MTSGSIAVRRRWARSAIEAGPRVETGRRRTSASAGTMETTRRPPVPLPDRRPLIIHDPLEHGLGRIQRDAAAMLGPVQPARQRPMEVHEVVRAVVGDDDDIEAGRRD